MCAQRQQSCIRAAMPIGRRMQVHARRSTAGSSPAHWLRPPSALPSPQPSLRCGARGRVLWHPFSSSQLHVDRHISCARLLCSDRRLCAASSVLPAIRPLEQGVLAQAIGNQWTQDSLRLVLVMGMVLAIPPGVLLLFFDDSKALGAVSEGLLASPEAQRAVAGAADVPGQAQPACHPSRHASLQLALTQLHELSASSQLNTSGSRCAQPAGEPHGCGGAQGSRLQHPSSTREAESDPHGLKSR